MEVRMNLQHAPIAKTEMLIRKPVIKKKCA